MNTNQNIPDEVIRILFKLTKLFRQNSHYFSRNVLLVVHTSAEIWLIQPKGFFCAGLRRGIGTFTLGTLNIPRVAKRYHVDSRRVRRCFFGFTFEACARTHESA